ncbi:hypothetical protein [Paraburkholderia phenazinium]|uniref:hypothetical protein n=1 Tax=Paraburkholderia phenazinium TaxID=60549 RepID=UPI00158C8FE3|nr:hypothetical protein [Paraburkholderia phenazinium]
MTRTDTPLHLDIAGSPERCLWLLDRNLVEWIMQSNAANEKLDDAKRTMLATLKEIDREGIYISPLASIIEGEKGRFDTAEEKLDCLKAETAALQAFFKVATLDSDYLQANQELAARVFTEHREAYGVQREIFFLQARKLIAAIREKSARPMVQEQLISIAAAVGLQLCDPILVLSIACL